MVSRTLYHMFDITIHALIIPNLIIFCKVNPYYVKNYTKKCNNQNVTSKWSAF